MYVNVENVNFAYDKKPILHDINFGMNKGEITGLIGPNGAGKSTMLKLMIKKMKPNNGKIIIGDNDIFSIKRENNPVTFIPDIPVYYEELTVWEHLQFIKALYPENSVTVDSLIREFNLNQHLNKIPLALSKGTLQKLMIALALLRQYDVLLADEPFNGLDPAQTYKFKNTLKNLKKQDKTILISTHLLSLAEDFCDRYIFLYDGRIVEQGTKAEILQKQQMNKETSLEQIYIWKAQISIYRLGRNWIIMGMILFTICLGIYKMPFYWTLPFLQQEEIRYMLLLGSIFAVFRLTLRSMVQQLDSILEKATDGLFIPISENRIVKQFMVIPITIVCGEGIIMAFVVNSSIAQILLGCAILICATVLNLWLEVKYKNFLVKKDFILSIAVFLGALILTK